MGICETCKGKGGKGNIPSQTPSQLLGKTNLSNIVKAAIYYPKK